MFSTLDRKPERAQQAAQHPEKRAQRARDGQQQAVDRERHCGQQQVECHNQDRKDAGEQEQEADCNMLATGSGHMLAREFGAPTQSGTRQQEVDAGVDLGQDRHEKVDTLLLVGVLVIGRELLALLDGDVAVLCNLLAIIALRV